MTKKETLLEILKFRIAEIDESLMPLIEKSMQKYTDQQLILHGVGNLLKDKKALNFDSWKKEFIKREVNDRFLHIDGAWWSFAEINWKYNDYKRNF
jgi:hypothetical protein